MADVGLRDLGSFVPGGRGQDTKREPAPPPSTSAASRIEPAAPPPPSVLVTPPPAAARVRAVFGGDRPEGQDALGIEAVLAPLAELAAHRGTQTPLCIGLLGGTGSGKSFALTRLAARIRDVAAAARTAGTGPFAAQVEVVSVDAGALDGEPALALAARLHTALASAYPDLARELGALARDPHVVLRETEEKLDESRRRLDAERRALDDAGSRRARLTETVLYEAVGSGVDAYARANRAGIESRLLGFGLAGDPVRTYKDLVQVVAGAGGALGLGLKSLWAFKGQSKLIVAAIVLVAIGVGLGIAVDDQSRWLGDLRDGPKAGASLADWFQTHMGLLATARTAAFGLAAVAIVANVLRALSFLRPILKGAKLLTGDLETRRRDLDGLYAHQTKRVDALEADVDRLSRAVAEAEQRAGGPGGQRQETSPFAPPAAAGQARAFFASLTSLMADARLKAPQRLVIALDHLDALDRPQAQGLLDTLSRGAGAGLVMLAAFDPLRLDPEGTRRGDLERWIQVPLRLERAVAPAAGAALIRDALGHGTAATAPVVVDPRRSDLDGVVDEEETALLEHLVDLAGSTPRAVKRLANLYLLARLGDDRPLAALAFMLALEIGGTAEERRTIAAALVGDAGTAFDLPQGAAPRLRAAWQAATAAAGGRIVTEDANAAARRAALFSLAPAA